MHTLAYLVQPRANQNADNFHNQFDSYCYHSYHTAKYTLFLTSVPTKVRTQRRGEYFTWIISLKNDTLQYTRSSLKGIVAKSKNCPFGVDTTIELKNITTSDNNGIWRDVATLSDVVVVLLSSIVVLTPNGSFWDVPVSNSVSEMMYWNNRN